MTNRNTDLPDTPTDLVVVLDTHAECVEKNGYQDAALEEIALNYLLHAVLELVDQPWN